MIWFLERGNSRLACELRRSEQSNLYEFEVHGGEGQNEMLACESPTELIEKYLRRHAQLQAEGWRPQPAPSVSFC